VAAAAQIRRRRFPLAGGVVIVARRLELAHRQHGDGRGPDDPLGDAAEQEAVLAVATAGPGRDHVGIDLASVLADLDGGAALADLGRHCSLGALLDRGDRGIGGRLEGGAELVPELLG